MTMSTSNVRRLRPRGQPAYGDSAALNDIHALLTTCSDPDRDVLACVGLILARTGRPMVRVRHIEVRVSETTAGRPAAHVEAEDTTVTVRQDPAGTGLLIEITTATAAERDALAVTLDGRPMHPAAPGGPAA